MGEHIKAGCRVDELPGRVPASRGPANSLLPGYRMAVQDAVAAARRHPRAADPAVIEGLLARRLGQPELTALLSYLDGGADAAAARLIREVRAYRPGPHSSANDLPTFLRILLLSQIDSV